MNKESENLKSLFNEHQQKDQKKDDLNFAEVEKNRLIFEKSGLPRLLDTIVNEKLIPGKLFVKFDEYNLNIKLIKDLREVIKENYPTLNQEQKEIAVDLFKNGFILFDAFLSTQDEIIINPIPGFNEKEHENEHGTVLPQENISDYIFNSINKFVGVEWNQSYIDNEVKKLKNLKTFSRKTFNTPSIKAEEKTKQEVVEEEMKKREQEHDIRENVIFKNEAFLDKLKIASDDIQQQIFARESEKIAAHNKWEKEQLLEQKINEEKTNELRKLFTEMGIVDAFEQLIDTKTLFITNYTTTEKEPIYGTFGKFKGYKTNEKQIFVPARINYETNGIFLVVDEYERPISFDSEGYVINSITIDESIGIKIIGDDKFEVGYYPSDHNSCNSYKNYIGKKIVHKDQVMNTLVRAVSTYRYNRDKLFEKDKRYRETNLLTFGEKLIRFP